MSLGTPKYENKNEISRQLVAHKDFSSIANLLDENSCDISTFISNFVAVFQNSYVFIPQFLAEPLTMFFGTLFGKHRLRV